MHISLIAASVTSQQIKWIRTLYHQITNVKSRPSTLLMDNQGAIIGAKSAAPTKKTKYIDVRHHILQQHAKDGIIKRHYVPTADLVADALTRPLTQAKFSKHTNTIQLTSVPHPRL